MLHRLLLLTVVLVAATSALISTPALCDSEKHGTAVVPVPQLHHEDPTFRRIVHAVMQQHQPGGVTDEQLKEIAAASSALAASLPSSRSDPLHRSIARLAREKFAPSGSVTDSDDDVNPASALAAREAGALKSSNPIMDLLAYYLGLPECVSSMGLMFSTNLFTYWIGGAFSNFGNFYACARMTPQHRWCMMDLKLMCVNFKNTTGKINITLSDLIEFNKYEDINAGGGNLVCNGIYNSMSSGVCYNESACSDADNSTTNISESLFRWSLDVRSSSMARLFLYPLCMTIETAIAKARGGPQAMSVYAAGGIPRCNVNYSFFYADPWCNYDNPVAGTGLDDSRAQAFLVCCILLLSVAGAATLAGFGRRVFAAIAADFFGANTVAVVARTGTTVAQNTGALGSQGTGARSALPSSKPGSREELQERLMSGDSEHSVNGGNERAPSTATAAMSPSEAAFTAAPADSGSAVNVAAADGTPAAGDESEATFHHDHRRATTGASMAAFSTSHAVSNAADDDAMNRNGTGKAAASRGGPDDNSCAAYALGFLDSLDFVSAFNEFMEVPRSDLPTGFFDGARVFCMLLVVAGHSFYYPFETTGNYGNTGEVMDFIKSYASIFVLPALLAVDTFFFISGYLSMSLMTKAIEKHLGDPCPPEAVAASNASNNANNGNVNTENEGEPAEASATAAVMIAPPAPRAPKPFSAAAPLLLMAYINRYLRLTPTMIVVLSVVAYLLPLWVSGPHARMLLQNDDIVGCRDNMWRAALYVQNLQNPEEYKCMSVTWFLMVDMQLFIFVPVWVSLCYLVKRYTTRGILSRAAAEWLLAGVVLCLTIAFFVVAVHHHPLTSPFQPDGSSGPKIKAYFRAMDRCVPYLTGILTAHIAAMPGVQRAWRGSGKWLSYLLNFVAFAAFITIWNVVWKMMSKFYTKGAEWIESHDAWQYGGHTVYFLLGPAMWMPLTLDAVVLGTRTWATRFLSHSFFQIYGKLSFGLYLAHPIAIWMVYATALEFHSFTRTAIFWNIGATVAFTSAFAYILYYLVDRPVGKFVGWLGAVTGAKKKKKAAVAAPSQKRAATAVALPES